MAQVGDITTEEHFMEFVTRPHLEELRGGTAHTLWFSIHYSEAKAEICHSHWKHIIGLRGLTVGTRAKGKMVTKKEIPTRTFKEDGYQTIKKLAMK